MNKLGVHAFVWEKGWSQDEAARAIDRSAAVGYDFIEAAALDPSVIDADYTRRRLEQAGLGINFSLGLDFDEDISSGDPEKRARGKAKLENAVRTCRDCGGSIIGGILYSAFGKYTTQPTARGIEESAETLRAVAEMAAQSDITLVLEVVNRYETNICNTAAQGVEMAKLVGAPNVKVHLDVYHMNIEESDIASAIVDTGEHLGYFHTGDSHRGYLGSGSIDLTAVFRALVRAKYRGPITFESFSSRVVGQPLEGILGIWRNLWEDGEDLASHALMYTKAQLKAAEEAERQARERSRLPLGRG
ncbi:sugar phosphate isomerase/epimerase family protein [Aureimonas psammosilenae]|uniref:sugar phosphate isomerase/epimerase family protein n=1 Tax=Aureimonas psammosilenae TaxID=2495496 RepID=UPI001260A5D1|nr:sugar phosphate isomerase/epimerase family protein [Aureimonas psammosilenae]